MRENNYIQVLWVENDPLITSAYPIEAELKTGIELCPFASWEEAETELLKDYERWDAIILDAKCKYRKDDADKATRFLSNVFPRLEKLATQKGRLVPWYVLSGQGEDDIIDLIPESNDWDKDWVDRTNRRFYSKNGKIRNGDREINEREMLFHRIRAHVSLYIHEWQLRHNLYPDVFEALNHLNLNDEIGYRLMQLLEPIHFTGTSNADYNHRYADLRKMLERILRHMVHMGILPSVLVESKNVNKVNIAWSITFLCDQTPKFPSNLNGKGVSKGGIWDKVIRHTEDPIVPRQLAEWLNTVHHQSSAAVHTTPERKEKGMNFEEYMHHVGGSPYMLRSLTMGLCDFILWYHGFLKQHPDEEINAVTFWDIRKNQS